MTVAWGPKLTTLAPRLGIKIMKTIQFIETYEATVICDFHLLENQVKMLKSFYSGEEHDIIEIEYRCDGSSFVVFDDGSTAVLPNDYFVITDWSDENLPEWGEGGDFEDDDDSLFDNPGPQGI